jgi:hypothetical protein
MGRPPDLAAEHETQGGPVLRRRARLALARTGGPADAQLLEPDERGLRRCAAAKASQKSRRQRQLAHHQRLRLIIGREVELR